jgi:Uma2 family endonuclease
MANAARKLMTVEEFLVWCLDQEDRYELEDGVPVRMMTCDGAIRTEGPQRRAEKYRASSRHDRIVINIISELRAQLKGSRCTPTTADIALRTKLRFTRRPDVMVTCDPPRPDIYEATDAKLVVEVLSPTNRGLRWQRKLEEYRHRAGLTYILLVKSRAPEAILLTRVGDGDGWQDTDFDGLDAVVDLTAIGCRLPMAEIYDGVTFDGTDPDGPTG